MGCLGPISIGVLSIPATADKTIDQCCDEADDHACKGKWKWPPECNYGIQSSEGTRVSENNMSAKGSVKASVHFVERHGATDVWKANRAK